MGQPDNHDKALMLDILNDQPDSSSFDELLRQLAFHRLIARGQQDADRGRWIDKAELKRRIKTWPS